MSEERFAERKAELQNAVIYRHVVQEYHTPLGQMDGKIQGLSRE